MATIKLLEEYQQQLIALIQSCQQTLRIRSGSLPLSLFNERSINDALSAFARRSRYCHIHILLDEPEQLLKHHSFTLQLQRRLSQKILIREYFDEAERERACTIIADSNSYLVKPYFDNEAGFMELDNKVATKELVDHFDNDWQLSTTPASLQRLS